MLLCGGRIPCLFAGRLGVLYARTAAFINIALARSTKKNNALLALSGKRAKHCGASPAPLRTTPAVTLRGGRRGFARHHTAGGRARAFLLRRSPAAARTLVAANPAFCAGVLTDGGALPWLLTLSAADPAAFVLARMVGVYYLCCVLCGSGVASACGAGALSTARPVHSKKSFY
jgi:hypothetical protein